MVTRLTKAKDTEAEVTSIQMILKSYVQTFNLKLFCFSVLHTVTM